MFGHRKANKLIEDIDRYFDLMRMSATDSEAGVLRREIENALYTQTAVSRVLRTSTISRPSSV